MQRFVADAPVRPWLTDITEDPTLEDTFYCAAVSDLHSRRIVGRSIADHVRSEFVERLDTRTWRRRTEFASAIVESIEGS